METQSSESPAALRDRLEALLESRDVSGLRSLLEALPSDEVARTITRLPVADQTALLRMLGSGEAADLLEDLPESQIRSMIEDLPAEDAADIVEELPGETQAELLREMSDAHSEAILDEMEREVSDEIRQRIEHHPESAGALMSNWFLSFDESQTAASVLRDMDENKERYKDYNVQYLYVTGPRGRLTGVLQIRNLLLAPRDTSLREIMIPNPATLPVETRLEKAVTYFEQFHYLALPVVNADGRLLGVLQREGLQEARAKRARKTFLKLSGIIGGDELRSLPLRTRALRRLAFLCPNIALNLVAASVIALYQDTIQAVIALAVFLPIISDMSGCSGNQAVAVSIRELSLGLIQPREFWRVFLKEGSIGVINGIAVGVLLGLVAYLWQDNLVLAAVVGGALALNTLISVVLGGMVPLFLKRFGADPALASAPILTTVTDMCGFFLVLNFASVFLSRLT